MKHLLFINLFFISSLCPAQNDSIPYSHEFEFNEGIYLTFSSFKQNKPVPVSAIVSGYPKNQLDFFTEVTREKTIQVKDNEGNLQKFETKSIWGYCRNRSVYINFNNQFSKINVIGTLCYFTATVTRSMGVPDPMGMNTTYEELHQFVYQTSTNKVYDFDAKNMGILLKNDDELYTRFMAMKKRDKPDAIFILLRKYNEKHPLYISGK